MKERNSSQFLQKYRDVIVAAVMLLIFAFFLIASNQIEVLINTSVDAKFFPRVISIMGMVFSVVNLVRAASAVQKGGVDETLEDPDDVAMQEVEKTAQSLQEQEKDEPEPGGWLNNPSVKAALTIGFLVVYLILADVLGFVLASALYLFAQITLMTPAKKRKWWLTALIAVVASVGCYVFFRNIFNLMLPSGILPF